MKYADKKTMYVNECIDSTWYAIRLDRPDTLFIKERSTMTAQYHWINYHTEQISTKQYMIYLKLLREMNDEEATVHKV